MVDSSDCFPLKENMSCHLAPMLEIVCNVMTKTIPANHKLQFKKGRYTNVQGKNKICRLSKYFDCGVKIYIVFRVSRNVKEIYS